MKQKDLSGKQFGLWYVKDIGDIISGRQKWKCVCACGTERLVDEGGLIYNKSKSCGCSRKKINTPIDLSQRRFGRLLVQYDTKTRNYKGSRVWNCICDCGKTIEVGETALLNGEYVSCGCWRKERQEKIYQTLHLVNHTCIEFLEKRNHRRDNTSGHQGVYRVSNGKYRVNIGFQGKRYHLGYYESLSEAIKVREKAEETLHKAFVKLFYSWKEKADEDPAWARENPFKINVHINEKDRVFEMYG